MACTSTMIARNFEMVLCSMRLAALEAREVFPESREVFPESLLVVAGLVTSLCAKEEMEIQNRSFNNFLAVYSNLTLMTLQFLHVMLVLQ